MGAGPIVAGVAGPGGPLGSGFIGRPVERVEDLRLLRGRGEYVDDVHRPGMLYAAILRSPVPHGRIRSLSVAAARAMPGVHAVLTASDIAERSNGKVPVIPLRLAPLPELEPYGQPVIAQDKVRYVGEPLAVVCADTLARAEDALDAISIEIEAISAVTDPEQGRRGDVFLFDSQGTNFPITYTATKGSSDAADAAPYRRRERFSVQRHTAVTMEPRGVVAIWDGPRTQLTVLGAAKVPYAVRRILARSLDLSEDCIVMIGNDVGGGFGVRGEFHCEDYLIPFASMKLGRPVKWTEDRRENLISSSHSREIDCELELCCDQDGRILALRGEAVVDMGAYLRSSGAIPARNVAQFISGPYRIPNIEMRSTMLVSNKTPVGTYRGPGRFEADFFRERLFDIVARDLGIDPLEFRRRNLISRDEMPYSLATITPVEKHEALDNGDYHACLDRCLAEFRWTEKLPLQGALVDGVYHGIAAGCFIEGGAAGPRENVRLVVEPDGMISLYTGSTNVGQALETSCLQIAADALDVAMSQIRIFHGSTQYLQEGFGSYHSRSVVMGGSAILVAAGRLKEAVRAAAAARLGCQPSDVTLGSGLLASGYGRVVPLASIADLSLSAEGSFENGHKHTYAYGSAAAHVTVDPKTGAVHLLDYVMVEDIGRIINPLTARGQAVGAVVQGLGGTFLEHLAYDQDGQFLSGTLADYLLPSAGEFPRIRAVMLEQSPSPDNPLGAKGGGEGGIIPVGGLLSNAVAAALQSLRVEPKDLPLSPPAVWRMIAKASGAVL
jgi:aerobic carbon-monoxide dehydrogenase large subunit